MAERVEGVSGFALAAAFTGGILAYSAVKGYRITIVARDIISGKDPSRDPQAKSSALVVTPAGLFSGILKSFIPGFGGGPGSGSDVSVTSGPGLQNFAKAVLRGIGAPATSENINSIIQWAN